MEVAFSGAIPDDDWSLSISGWIWPAVAKAVAWPNRIAQQS